MKIIQTCIEMVDASLLMQKKLKRDSKQAVLTKSNKSTPRWKAKDIIQIVANTLFKDLPSLWCVRCPLGYVICADVYNDIYKTKLSDKEYRKRS